MASKLGRAAWIVGAAALVVGLGIRITQARARQTALEDEVKAKMAHQAAAQPALAAVPLEARGEGLQAAPEAHDVVYFSGELRPASEAELSFKVGGRLAKIEVEAGQWVKEGQPLLRLEDREAQAQSRQAHAAVAAAKAQAKIAEDTEKRMAVLGEKGAVSAQQRLGTQGQAELASAQLAQVQAAADLADLLVDNHVLRAPFAGRVTRVPGGIGAMMPPGVPVTGVVDSAHWKVFASVSLEDAARVKAGARVHFSTPGLQSGVIADVSPILQERSRRVQFQVAVDTTHADLFAGALVSGDVIK